MSMHSDLKSQLQKYYALPLWQEYRTAYSRWEECHDLYTTNPNDQTRASLIASMDAKDELMTRLRETPQHKLAFGW